MYMNIILVLIVSSVAINLLVSITSLLIFKDMPIIRTIAITVGLGISWVACVYAFIPMANWFGWAGFIVPAFLLFDSSLNIRNMVARANAQA